MRASESEQTASIGVNEVSAAFERFGWGPVENKPHDLGTDLFVQVRDRRLFDQGVVIGVQVKTGPSYFDEPKNNAAGEPEGWWYRDDDKRHTDSWASHGLPHLLVLHDLESRTSYWVHVTADAVLDTGVGAKILVPRRNTLDEAKLDELMEVAGTARPAVPLEGTAWTGAVPPAARDHLRFALVVPRLVAPHPNARVEQAITPAQAVALLMQARLRELRRHAETFAQVPTLTAARTASAWGWRLVGALGSRILDDELDPIRAVITDAPTPEARAASTVVLASALITTGHAANAVGVLDAALARDDAWPLDDAWLRIQRARALLEVGALDRARDDAIVAQKVGAISPHDVTATAISGIAAAVVYNTAAWEQRDFGSVIQAVDTVADWWRTQTTLRGVSAVAERTFKAWANDASVTLAGSDEANNQLYVAALTASHLGDQGAWRRLSGLLARDGLLRLDRHADPADAASSLDTLRLAGDEKAVPLAVHRLADDGPVEAVRAAGAQIDFGNPTRTTVFADLALLEHGGDLLDEETATVAVRWLLATLDDPAAFLTLTSDRGFVLPATIAECLSGLVPVIPEVGVTIAAERVPKLPDDDDVVTRHAWAKVLYALPTQAWTRDASLRLIEGGVPPQDSELHWPVLLIASRHDQRAREQLLEAARGGSVDALAHLGSPAQSDPELVGAVTRTLTASLAAMREKARDGKVGIPARDPAGALATLLSKHPDDAQVETLLDFLDDDNIPRTNKRRALQVLALGLDQFPVDAHRRLAAIAERVARRPSAPEDPLFDQDIRGEAGTLSAMLVASDRERFAHRFYALLAGGAAQRAWAARLPAHIASDEYAPALAALACDDHTIVRAAAAGSLVRLVAAGRGGTLAETALRGAAQDTGRQVPAAIAAALEAADALSPAARSVAEFLQTHISAAVRERATAAVQRS